MTKGQNVKNIQKFIVTNGNFPFTGDMLISLSVYIYIYIYIYMVDFGESDKMIKTIGKMDKSDTLVNLHHFKKNLFFLSFLFFFFSFLFSELFWQIFAFIIILSVVSPRSLTNLDIIACIYHVIVVFIFKYVDWMIFLFIYIFLFLCNFILLKHPLFFKQHFFRHLEVLMKVY